VHTGNIVSRADNHNHPPSNSEVIAQDRFVHSLRSTARDDFHHSARTIFTRSIASQAAAPGVAYNSVKHAIYSERGRSLPRTLNTRDDIETSGEWGSTLRGDRFLLPSPDKDLLIFATDENIRTLASCNLWLMDGTFKCVPSVFSQLYTIHGEIGERVVPLMFAYLPKKQAATYRLMFQRLFAFATLLGV